MTKLPLDLERSPWEIRESDRGSKNTGAKLGQFCILIHSSIIIVMELYCIYYGFYRTDNMGQC